MVSTFKIEEMLLEQQIARLLESKLLHVATVSSRCYYVDLEFPFLSFFQILTLVCTTASEPNFPLTLPSFLPSAPSSQRNLHITACVTTRPGVAYFSILLCPVSAMVPLVAIWLVESSNFQLNKSLLMRITSLLSCPVCNATYPPELTKMLQMH